MARYLKSIVVQSTSYLMTSVKTYPIVMCASSPQPYTQEVEEDKARAIMAIFMARYHQSI